MTIDGLWALLPGTASTGRSRYGLVQRRPGRRDPRVGRSIDPNTLILSAAGRARPARATFDRTTSWWSTSRVSAGVVEPRPSARAYGGAAAAGSRVWGSRGRGVHVD